MRYAEQVTFGGAARDRAAQLRGDDAALARLWQSGAARVLPIWRGKPLFKGAARDRLGWLPANHPGVAGKRDAALFLGLDGGAGRFAVDLSDWQPAMQADVVTGFLDLSEQPHPALPADTAFAELRRLMAGLGPLDAASAAVARALFGWHRSHGHCAHCGARVALSMAGWQSVCPGCGRSHFPRTDPVVIMLVTHGNSVLLGRSPGWPEGMYSLLAGFVEPGETIEAAVRREVSEETGVAVAEVGYLASQPWPFPASLMIGCRGRAITTEITIDPVEIADAQWVSRERVLAVFAGEDTEILTPRAGSIARFLMEYWLADCLD